MNNSYFSHDSNARNSDKLLSLRMALGAEGYGIYFMVLERLREEPSYMSIKDYNMLAFDFRVGSDKVKRVIEDFGLFVFTDDGKYFYSEGFRARMEVKDSNSEKARKSALSRWRKNADEQRPQCERNANALQTHCKSNAIKEKESKGNAILTDSRGEHPNGCPPDPPKIEVETKSSDKKPPVAERFVPPTAQQVEEYCRERGNRVSPVKFINYYTSNGWRVGKNPMKDWKAAVRTWENNNYDHADQHRASAGTPPPANVNYTDDI